MHWVILPSGRAINVAQVVATTEAVRTMRSGGEDVPVTVLHFAQSTQEDTLPRLVLWGPERDVFRSHLAQIAEAGTWPT